jgi:hypothetical protein
MNATPRDLPYGNASPAQPRRVARMPTATPTWVLNRFDSCWRWLVGRNDSTWHQTLRQFRQPRPGDWQTVMREVSEALAAYAR